jgi:polysaccharide biosynthesis protein PslH
MPFPLDNGARIRAFYLLREMARHHTVHLVSGQQSDSPTTVPDELSSLCASVTLTPWTWYDRGVKTGKWGELRSLFTPKPRSVVENTNSPLTQAIARACETHKPDAIVVLAHPMDEYLPNTLPQVPLILPDIELSGMLHAAQTGGIKQKLTAQKGARYWHGRLQKYTHICACSEEEASVVAKVAGKHVTVLPNGVALEAYSSPLSATPSTLPRSSAVPPPAREGGQVAGLIYSGSLTYDLNEQAVDWFLEAVLPFVRAQIPEACLTVTGRKTPAHEVKYAHAVADKSLVFTGFVADINPVLQAAQVCVVPLLKGGGTRLKILEAWALGVPVVSTTIGASGLGAISGTNCLLADTPEAFAQSVIALLSDKKQQETLAHNARCHVEARFDWRQIGEILNQLLERPLLEGGS